jgi:hypothetical protein
MSEVRHGVLISDGRSSVRLRRNGEARELGYPTMVELQAGPFQGAISDELLDYGHFETQLRALYASLRGGASLSSYDGFALDLIGDGLGGVEVRIKAIGQHFPLIQLIFSFSIDQTYLPAIIDSVGPEFPPPHRDLSFSQTANRA